MGIMTMPLTAAMPPPPPPLPPPRSLLRRSESLTTSAQMRVSPQRLQTTVFSSYTTSNTSNTAARLAAALPSLPPAPTSAAPSRLYSIYHRRLLFLLLIRRRPEMSFPFVRFRDVHHHPYITIM